MMQRLEARLAFPLVACLSCACTAGMEQFPRWIEGTAKDDEIVSMPFWSTPRTLVVQQFSTVDPMHPTCRARDAGTDTWYRPRGGCLQPDFSYLYRVDAGPAGLVALHSSAEGHAAVSVVRYSVNTGQSAPLVTFHLEGASTVEVAFAPDGSRIDFVTPCTLDALHETQCLEPELAPRWKLYSVPATGGAPVLRRDDLPPATASKPGR
jgi:hypothetical protein